MCRVAQFLCFEFPVGNSNRDLNCNTLIKLKISSKNPKYYRGHLIIIDENDIIIGSYLCQCNVGTMVKNCAYLVV